MATEVITTSPDALLADAARLLTERKIGCLPVLDNGRLAGIVTEGFRCLSRSKIRVKSRIE